MGVEEYAGYGRRYWGVPTFAVTLSPSHSCDSLAFCFGSTEIRSRDFLARRLWLGIWVRRALMDMAYLDSGSCWPPPDQPLLSPLALGHSVISQETTLAASAGTGLSLLCLLQVTSLALLKSLRSSPHDTLSPPVPWASHPIQPGQGFTSLQGALPQTTIFVGIQHKESRVTDTKKILYAIYQASPPRHI